MFYTRREFLGLSLAAGGYVLSGGVAAQPDPEFLHRNHSPVNIETPVEGLRTFITPNEAFYVRSHHAGEPVLSPTSWRLAIEGAVQNPRELSLTELLVHPQKEMLAILQCSGNGRYRYRPRIPGGGWEHGAIGNALWSGVPLKSLLEQSNVDGGARYIALHGYDKPVVAKTPKFAQVLPIEKAMDPNTLVAFHMNGSPLSHLHGAPARMVVPGWQGQKWVKWLSHIEVVTTEPDEYWYSKSYRVPLKPVKPGADVPQEAMVPIEEIPVKSILVTPLTQSAFKKGQRVIIEGKAWTGGAKTVKKVEIATGSGWKVAQLLGEELPYTWREFRLEWNPERTGRHTLRCRATDSAGTTQPEKAPWNPGGYNWNGYDEIHVEVV